MNTITVNITALRRPNGQPNPDAIRLYRALATEYTMAIVSDTDDYIPLSAWVQGEIGRPMPSFIVIPQFADPDGVSRRSHQLRQLTNGGNTIAYAIETNPSITAELLKDGWNVLHYAHPQYTQPAHRPDWDGSIRAWDAIEAEIDRQRDLRNSDQRLIAEN